MSDHDDGADKPNKKRSRKKPYSPRYEGNDKGGWGNPPVSHQFKKNGPPGPGRPRGVTTLEAAMAKVLKGQVLLKSGGSTDYFTALAIAGRDASLAKTVKGTEFGFTLVQRFLPQEDGPQPDYTGLTFEELLTYGALAGRIYNVPPSEPPPNPLRTRIETGEGYFRVERGGDGHLHMEKIGTLDDKVTVDHVDSND